MKNEKMKDTVMAVRELIMKEWISSTQEVFTVYKSVSGGALRCPLSRSISGPPVRMSLRLDILIKLSPIKHTHL